MGALIAAGVGLAVAGAGAAYAAHESSAAQKSVAGNKRALGPELGGILDQAPDYLRTEQAFDWQAGQNQLGLEDDFFSQVLKRYPELAQAERVATTQQRYQDSKDLDTSGRRMQGIFESLAPELRESGDALHTMLQGVGQSSDLLKGLNTEAEGRGPSDINSRLHDYALSELDKGDALGADERRQVLQDTRAGFSQRGLAGGNLATIDEVLNLSGARRARELERVQLAGGIDAALRGERADNRNFALGVEGLNQQEVNSDRAFIPAAVGAGNARLAPLLSLFGGRATTTPATAAGIMSAAPNPTGTSAASLRDVLTYGSDVFDTNFNALESRANARANNAAAIGGAAVGAGGQVAGAGVKAKYG
jgi:hypothetical protein